MLFSNPRNMYIRLIRNAPSGSTITGRLVINGRWFCYTLEHVGHQLPALCYPVRVTMSSTFHRLLPFVQNVPCHKTYALTFCIANNNPADFASGLSGTPGQAGRSSAEVERALVEQILQAQESHEEIILDISDFRPGTEYGYNTPCPPQIQKR